MDKGNWIPMDKSLVSALSRKRPYTFIEAAFSYRLHMDNGTVRRYREYTWIWSWTKNRGIGFIWNKAYNIGTAGNLYV